MFIYVYRGIHVPYMGPDGIIWHIVRQHSDNCSQKSSMQNDMNMHKPAYHVKAVETEMSKASGMRIQDKGQLE